MTQRGDTLADIAERAYGDTDRFSDIFAQNRDVLRDPNVVPIGVGLFVPCLGGQVTAGGELSPIRSGEGDELSVLTGNNYAPYVDDDLPEGGFSTELVHRALQWDGQPVDYSIDVIRDWSSHLGDDRSLLARGAYDLGYPWLRPDCSQYDRLGDASQWRCDNLLFSRPLHEIVMTAYARTGTVDEISSPEDARDLTLCRPSGYYTGDLEAFGLAVSGTLVSPDTPTDCFELLRDGEVDVVTINADTADAVSRELGIDRDIEELVELSTIPTLHVVGMRSNPRTRIHLRRIDLGLRGLEESGQMSLIFPKHL